MGYTVSVAFGLAFSQSGRLPETFPKSNIKLYPSNHEWDANEEKLFEVTMVRVEYSPTIGGIRPPSPTSSEGLLDKFKDVRECDYKGEHYSVRDNGAVMRHPKLGGKVRRLDHVWTFGKRDEKTAYMMIGSHRVHIIVANAFLGEHDSKVYVVDHIDTNRCNNRVENLRWFTRLENALNNPITRKRIEFLCGGDIQKFIDNPACLRSETITPDLSWMRTVTPEEACNALENLKRWAERVPQPKTGILQSDKPRDHEWIFKPPRPDSSFMPSNWTSTKKEVNQEGMVPLFHDVIPASSPTNAVQRNWRTPTDFLLCPETSGDSPLVNYFARLQKGAKFCENRFGGSSVIKAFLSDDAKVIGLATESANSLKPFAACKIVFEDGKFVHESIQTCFDVNGALKRATVAVGQEWVGPDGIDDYC